MLLAQAFGGMINVTGDPSRAATARQSFHGGLHYRAHRLGRHDDGAVGGEQDRARAGHRSGAVRGGGADSWATVMPLYTGARGGVYGHTGNRHAVVSNPTIH